MFGAHALYRDEKIILILNQGENHPKDMVNEIDRPGNEKPPGENRSGAFIPSNSKRIS
jgi:hypothetical protein